MAFNATQTLFLQRLVEERPAFRQTSSAGRYFCEHFSIGHAAGRRIEYTVAHLTAAKTLLIANDLPVKALGAEATRADSAEYGGMSEKTFSAAPHANSVAVKSIGACYLDGHFLHTPEGAYLVLRVAQAVRVTCERILVVENLETFRALEAYGWIDTKNLSFLAIYRGDKDLSNKNVVQVVASRREPIWGFFDFDPAGLAMANSLPAERFEHLLLPDWTWLEKSADTARGRQLFDKQEHSFASVLEGAANPEVSAAWRLMKRLRSAVAQERMLTAMLS